MRPIRGTGTNPTRRGFLIGAAAATTSTMLLPRGSVPHAAAASTASASVALIVDVRSGATSSVEHWVEQMFVSAEVGMAAAVSDPDRLHVATAINRVLHARRVLLHSTVNMTGDVAVLDEMRRGAERFPLDGWDLRPIGGESRAVAVTLDLAARLGVRIVHLHPAADRSITPSVVAELARNFPEIELVIAGVPAMPSSRHLADELNGANTRNVWFEIGTSVGDLAMKDPGRAANALRVLSDALGEDRLLWATNADPETATRMLAAMRELPVPAPMIEKVVGANAACLYRLSSDDIVSVDGDWRARLHRCT